MPAKALRHACRNGQTRLSLHFHVRQEVDLTNGTSQGQRALRRRTHMASQAPRRNTFSDQHHDQQQNHGGYHGQCDQGEPSCFPHVFHRGEVCTALAYSISSKLRIYQTWRGTVAPPPKYSVGY
jgi:hypothetical protein